MGEQSDLGEQPDGHPGGERQEGPVPAKHGNRRSLGLPGRVVFSAAAVRILTDILRALRKDGCKQSNDGGDHDAAYDQRRPAELQGGNREYPDRGHDHAAQCRAVIGQGEGEGAALYEPGGNEAVQRDRTHGGPSASGDAGRQEQEHGMIAQRPAHDARRQRDNADPGRADRAETGIQGGHAGNRRGADQEMDRHRRRHQGDRPARALDDRLKIDRRSVKAEAPSEHGDR